MPRRDARRDLMRVAGDLWPLEGAPRPVETTMVESAMDGVSGGKAYLACRREWEGDVADKPKWYIMEGCTFNCHGT